MSNREMVEKQINTSLIELKVLEGEARKEKLKEIETLYQLVQTDDKNDIEADIALRKISAEIEKNDLDRELEKSKEAENKKFKIADSVLAGVGTIGPMLLYATFMRKGFKFETEGVYTSKTFSLLASKVTNLFKK